jgi:hypothetical protein
MPAELWEAAARAAQRLGVYSVARDLRLSYDSLKKRTEAKEDGGDTIDIGGFVEVSGAQLVGCQEKAAVELELKDEGGRILKISLSGGVGLDVVGLTEAFWNRRG